MAEPARELTREQELRAAIEKATLLPRDYRIFMALFFRAEWVTAVIPERFQPRSLDELAAWSQMSKANLATGLGHLQRHLWLERHRHLTDKGIGGRGRPTRYVLCLGRDCDCSKASRSKTVPEVSKASKNRVAATPKASKNRVLNRPDHQGISAGQSLVPAEEGREEGERGEGSPKPEYTGGPTPWEPAPHRRFPNVPDFKPGTYGHEANR